MPAQCWQHQGTNSKVSPLARSCAIQSNTNCFGFISISNHYFFPPNLRSNGHFPSAPNQQFREAGYCIKILLSTREDSHPHSQKTKLGKAAAEQRSKMAGTTKLSSTIPFGSWTLNTWFNIHALNHQPPPDRDRHSPLRVVLLCRGAFMYTAQIKPSFLCRPHQNYNPEFSIF